MCCVAGMQQTSDLNVTDSRPPLAIRHSIDTLCAVSQ